MADGGSDDKKEAKPSLKERLPQILKAAFLVLNFGIMGGTITGAYYWKLVYKRPAITEETEKASLEKNRHERHEWPTYYSLDRFVVNLEGRPRKVLSTTVQLEMLNEEGYEEVVQLGARTRDNVVRVFNGTKFEEIESVQGKLLLKDKIMAIVNHDLKTATVKDVHFGEFIVQRL